MDGEGEGEGEGADEGGEREGRVVKVVDCDR